MVSYVGVGIFIASSMNGRAASEPGRCRREESTGRGSLDGGTTMGRAGTSSSPLRPLGPPTGGGGSGTTGGRRRRVLVVGLCRMICPSVSPLTMRTAALGGYAAARAVPPLAQGRGATMLGAELLTSVLAMAPWSRRDPRPCLVPAPAPPSGGNAPSRPARVHGALEGALFRLRWAPR